LFNHRQLLRERTGSITVSPIGQNLKATEGAQEEHQIALTTALKRHITLMLG